MLQNILPDVSICVLAPLLNGPPIRVLSVGYGVTDAGTKLIRRKGSFLVVPVTCPANLALLSRSSSGKKTKKTLNNVFVSGWA